jgi:UDP-N-acetylmuramate--alanine ligase
MTQSEPHTPLATLSLSSVRRIHMIGIGGIGMSALARLFVHEKKQVSGSDRSQTLVTEGLTALGVGISYTQGPENITSDIDLVVYTSAMSLTHAELVRARECNIPTMTYFDALALFVNSYYLIAVSGTHGKTTTTAMLADIFEDAGLDPTVIVGSLRTKTHTNFRAGKSKYAIVEACEFERHFLSLTPTVLVITNIEAEHLDYYKDLEDVESAFRSLAEKVPHHGYIVADLSSESVKRVIAGLSCRVMDYRSHLNLTLPMHVPGLHNRMNAAAAYAVGKSEGILSEAILHSLTQFRGTWRRFEFKGKLPNGTSVYDDYGHHPTEIRATLTALREKHHDKKILCAFHPHLYSRTKLLFTDFVHALSLADEVVLAPIYAAREHDDGSVTSEMLANAISEHGTPAQAFLDFQHIERYLLEHCDQHTVIMTMGAGDIYTIADALTNKESVLE